MKSHAIKLCLAVAVASICYSQQSSAIIINDNYEGASSVKSNGTSYGDVIGSVDNFQINYMDVSISGNILSVSIDTTFGGKGDDGLFSSSTYSGNGIGYGDLFLSSAWTPFGSDTGIYAGDDNSNGTVWSYGFSLDNRWGVEDVEHQGTLYSLNSHNDPLITNPNNVDTYLSDDFLSISDFYYRNGQEIAVDTDNGDVTAVGGGTWNTTVNRVNFEIDLTGTALAGSQTIALHWGMTCGNDTIEGTYSVPEPSILGLLVFGLIGISVSKRKNA